MSGVPATFSGSCTGGSRTCALVPANFTGLTTDCLRFSFETSIESSPAAQRFAVGTGGGEIQGIVGAIA